MHKIIFIVGKVGSGKDTVADYLCNKYRYDVFRYADDLKSTLFYAGWDGKKDLKGRKLLQDVGKAFRNYDINFWVNKLFEKITNYNLKKICIADVRHENEVEHFKDQWYKLHPDTESVIIKVIGPNRDINREMDNLTTNDISETGMDNYVGICNTIHNNKTKEDLYLSIDKIMESVFSNEE